MDPINGNHEARKLVEKEYGDPFKISTAYINKVLTWPIIKQQDSLGLQHLALFLVKCESAMSSIFHMSVLNHAPNIQAIVQKLPFYLQNKWRDHVFKLKQGLSVNDVNFSDLTKFVVQASESANDPVYGKEALNTLSKPKITNKSGNKAAIGKTKSSSLVTGVELSSETRTTKYPAQNNKPKYPCPWSMKSHDLDECFQFG